MRRAAALAVLLILSGGGLTSPTAAPGDGPEDATAAATVERTATAVQTEEQSSANVKDEAETSTVAAVVVDDIADELVAHPDRLGTDTAAVATSECGLGYRRLQANGGCVDINECQEYVDDSVGMEDDRRDVCGNYVHSHMPGYRCINTPGSYRCERIVDCGFGYKLDKSLGVCVDIDECEVMGYETACGLKRPIKVCINLEGTFRCQYRSCQHNQHLDRTTGQCRPCQTGFAKNSRGVCEDIDECERLTSHQCPPHMRCVNYIGGYECKHKIFCSMGRRTNYNGTECVDIDECTEQPTICGLGRNCFNTDGFYRCELKQCDKNRRLDFSTGECVCVEGFRNNATAKLCQDINECLEGVHNCDPSDVCRNTKGHFDCLSKDKVCQPGFGLSFDHSTCVDIDECKLGQFKCRRHEFCNNTYGSYTCLCSPGFQRSDASTECLDVDECALAATSGSGSCSEPFQCVNTIGSFACDCPSGYRRSGVDCVDIDECAHWPAVCGPAGGCSNQPVGAYTCDCPAGYMATASVGGTCVDIDECSLRACPAAAVCSNTDGGYDCLCRDGFRFVRDSNECEDIDECQQLTDPCRDGLSCFNYRSHYSCYQHACPPGFKISRKPLRRGDMLSFSCLASDACKMMPSFVGNVTATQLCAKRYRIVHKALEIKASRGEFSTVQSDMRRDHRSCQFKAVLWKNDSSSETVIGAGGDSAGTFPGLQFEHKTVGKFTMCATKMRLDDNTWGVTKIQLEVALIHEALADISSNTIHIVRV